MDSIQFFGRYEETPSCESPVRVFSFVLLTPSSCPLTWHVTIFQMNVTLTFKLTEFAYFFFSAQMILYFFYFLLKTQNGKNPNNTLIVYIYKCLILLSFLLQDKRSVGKAVSLMSCLSENLFTRPSS